MGRELVGQEGFLEHLLPLMQEDRGCLLEEVIAGCKNGGDSEGSYKVIVKK